MKEVEKMKKKEKNEESWRKIQNRIQYFSRLNRVTSYDRGEWGILIARIKSLMRVSDDLPHPPCDCIRVRSVSRSMNDGYWSIASSPRLPLLLLTTIYPEFRARSDPKYPFPPLYRRMTLSCTSISPPEFLQHSSQKLKHDTQVWYIWCLCW